MLLPIGVTLLTKFLGRVPILSLLTFLVTEVVINVLPFFITCHANAYLFIPIRLRSSFAFVCALATDDSFPHIWTIR